MIENIDWKLVLFSEIIGVFGLIVGICIGYAIKTVQLNNT